MSTSRKFAIVNVGEIYGRLTVEELLQGTYVRCKCSCGNEIVTRRDHLKRGVTRSCGCFKKDALKHRASTHGLSKHPLYKTWQNMRNRCSNPKATKYELYGGRGISVCDQWQTDFMSFYNWALASGWSPGLSIDRINPNEGYSPQNCRWATHFEQNDHLRSNHMVTYQGKTQPVYAWARELGMHPNTLGERLRRGWSIDRAFGTEVVK